MRVLLIFCKFLKKMRNRQFLRVLLNRMMIDFNVFEIYESCKGDLLEICGFMEARWRGIGWPPSKISCCCVGSVVHSKEIYFVFALGYASSDNFKSNFELCLPPFYCWFGIILCQGATLVLSS